MSLIPGITSAIAPVIGGEMAAESFKVAAGQYHISIDPASNVTATESIAGLKLTVPVAAPTTHTATFDALSNKLTTVVNGVTAVTDLGALDDEGVTMSFAAGNLVLKNKAGATLSTTPIPDVDAQTLTKTVAASGITIAISGGNSIVLTTADLAAAFPPTTNVLSTTGVGPARTLTSVVNGVSATTPIPDADAQTLAIGGTASAPTLAISGGNTVNLPTLAGLASAATVTPPNAAGATPPGYIGADGLVHPFTLFRSSLGTPIFWAIPA